VTLVGLGAMGLRHARVLAALPRRFQVAGAFDVRREANAPAACLADEAEAIARAEVVLVATPSETHAGIAERALSAGRHVLVEKPLCATWAEAEPLVRASARSGARLFVGHSERFNPVVRALRRLVRDESVLTLDFQRVGPSMQKHGGALVNLGVHDFDLAAYLGGGDVALRGALGEPARDGTVDFAHVLFVTACGAAGHLYVDRTAPAKRRSLTLTTARWLYEGDLLSHRLWRTARATGARTDVPLTLEEPLVAQALALADALDGRPAREIATGVDGARAVSLAESAATCCSAGAEKLPLLATP